MERREAKSLRANAFVYYRTGICGMVGNATTVRSLVWWGLFCCCFVEKSSQTMNERGADNAIAIHPMANGNGNNCLEFKVSANVQNRFKSPTAKKKVLKANANAAHIHKKRKKRRETLIWCPGRSLQYWLRFYRVLCVGNKKNLLPSKVWNMHTLFKSDNWISCS